MTQEILLIFALFSFAVLACALVGMLLVLNRTLASLGESLRRLQGDLTPMLGDLRVISRNLAGASEAVRLGAQNLGALASPWMGLLKLLRRF
jgi:hypothetical protein